MLSSSNLFNFSYIVVIIYIMNKKYTKEFIDNLDKIVPWVSSQYCELWGKEYPPKGIVGNELVDKEILDKMKNLDEFILYLHFPFCIDACDYCRYYARNDIKKFGSKKYIDCLKKEIEFIFKKELSKKKKILSIYLGGGTPTLINKNDLVDLFKYLNCNFKIPKNIKISIEGMPRNITEGLAKVLAEIGVNRVSLGVQTFNQGILKYVNRFSQNNKDVYKAVKYLRKEGIKDINLDFIFGLKEDEIVESFLKDNLEHLKILKPPSIHLYQLQNYIKHPESILKKSINETKKLRKSIELEVKNCYVSDVMTLKHSFSDSLGCNEYFMLRRVNMKPVLGFGLGAASFFWNNNQFVRVRKQTEDINKYRNFSFGYKYRILSIEESIRKYIIFNLTSGIDLKVIKNNFSENMDIYNKILEPIKRVLLIDNNFLFLKKDYIKIAPFKTNNDVVDYFIFVFCFLFSEEMQKRLLDTVLRNKKFKMRK